MKIAIPENQFADQAGHWYKRDGSPAYTVIGKNGKERAATIRDARELDLVPSVTTIMQLEAKPALTRWLIEQGMLSCLTLPRQAGEDDTTFIRRALDDSKQQTRKAADRGSWLHGLIEDSMRIGGRLCNRCPKEDEAFIVPVLNWIATMFPDYRWSPERSFASALGYGGKMDLIGEHPDGRKVIIDYKTKDFVDHGKKLAYDEHCTQLAAYGRGQMWEEFDAVNLFVSTRVSGLLVPYQWSQQEIGRGWRAFQHLLGLWRCRKGYALEEAV